MSSLAMSRARLIWRLWPSYLLAVLVCLLVALFSSLGAARTFLEGETARELQRMAETVALPAGEWLASGQDPAATDYCREIERRTGTRITVIGLDGSVLADSSAEPAAMENHGDRPEIREAFAGRTGVQQGRFSDTLRLPMVYVAIPIRRADGAVTGVCRAARAVESLSQIRAILVNRILLGGLLAILLGVPFTLYISRRVIVPIQRMQRVAERLTNGDMSARMPMDGTRELAALGNAVNAMAADLAERIRNAVEQREELAAILSSMSEGLLAIDSELRILRMNGAAERLLQVGRDQALGMGLVEAVRNPAMHRAAQDALASERPVESEIALRLGGEETFLQVRASRLTSPGGGATAGAVMVLTDVTRLKRLENLRRDFAANVSHELRTPVTSILGFVETLRDGAIEDREDAMRFLGIVHSQAMRLDALIRDLLALARIERDDENGIVRLARMPVKCMVQSVLDGLSEQAKTRGVRIEVDCPEKIEAEVNSGLFEQALGNLLDNAIKYGNENAVVRVAVARDGKEIRVEVTDQGGGIAPEHLDRLFERFYRVDKARSRDHGGTGLGLAIVKHVCQYHRGRVEVRSELGRGSTFAIVLPAPADGDGSGNA